MTTDSRTDSPSPALAILISVLLVVWLIATLAGLWWFQQKNVRPFVETGDDPAFWRPASAAASLTPLLSQLAEPAPGQITLLHFWNPGCLCNQISQRHFDGLVAAFNEQQLRILVIAPPSASDGDLQRFRELNGHRMAVQRAPQGLSIPASPGLALYGPDMQLGYFGAYGFGALCTVANDDFFPNIVRSLQRDGYGPFVNVAGSGCFCAWPDSTGTGE